jgi:chromate reductase
MRVGAWCGSLGQGSANAAALAVAAEAVAGRGVEVLPVDGLDEIPPFRAELVDTPPDAVADFRTAIESVDGVLMAAPEYAGGLAGVVKNALDWLVGSGSLYHRLVGVMSAGTTGGEFAIEQLVRTVSWQGGLVVATLSIASPRTKQDDRGAFTDPATLTAIREWSGTVVDAHGEPATARLARVASIVAPLGIDPERFGDLA